jgi:branched-chain amino acid transport system substrate-binding protein
LSASSTADAIKDAGDYIFRNVPTNSAQGKSAAEFAANKLKAKKAAILYMNNDYGLSLKKSFERYSVELGGQIPVIESYNPGDKDFKTQLGKIKSSNPDIVFYPGHYQESGLILKQARELGIKAVFIGGDGSYSPDLIKIAGNAAEGSYYTIMAMGFGVADAEIEKFKGEFQKKYNQEPDVYSAYAYDALRMIANAIQKGGYTSAGIKTALYGMKDFKGVTGITSFDKNGEVDKPFYIYVVKNGKFEIVR